MTVSISRIREFREAIRLLEREITGQLRSETGCCGVSLAQCHTLLELDSAGPLSLSELAGRFALDQSTLSRTVDNMVREGWLKRAANPDDRRAVRLDLTASGKKKAQSIHAGCDEFYTRLFDGLSPKQRESALEGIVALAQGIRGLRNAPSCCSVPTAQKRSRKET
jgi:DNA-binding MarR family transcriptional regulator